jgi:hypothetical protein
MRGRAGLGWKGAGALLALALCAPQARADASLEYAVKAAYLTKFIPFISWPADSFETATSPVTICLVGDDPFHGALQEAARAAQIGERPLVVRHLQTPEAGCRMVFVAAADPALAGQVLEALKGKPVVTVTDSGLNLSGQDMHGVISFAIEANHVRFDIDAEAADRDGLVISSKLLALARKVHSRGAP